MNDDVQARLRFLVEQRRRLVGSVSRDPNLVRAPREERVMFLRYVGTSRQLEQTQDALLGIAEVARRSLLSNAESAAVTEGLSVLGRRLEELRITAEWAETLLTEEGLAYDPIKDKVKAIPDPKAPNRPGELLNREIERAYREVNLGEWRNTQEIRDEIYAALRYDWPPEQIDPRPGGPLAQAIRNYLKTHPHKRRR